MSDPNIGPLVQAYQEHAALRCSPPPDSPPLEWGERCRLLAGGPVLLVVGYNDEVHVNSQGPVVIDGNMLTVASATHEMPLARWCLRRVR